MDFTLRTVPEHSWVSQLHSLCLVLDLLSTTDITKWFLRAGLLIVQALRFSSKAYCSPESDIWDTEVAAVSVFLSPIPLSTRKNTLDNSGLQSTFHSFCCRPGPLCFCFLLMEKTERSMIPCLLKQRHPPNTGMVSVSLG